MYSVIIQNVMNTVNFEAYQIRNRNLRQFSVGMRFKTRECVQVSVTVILFKSEWKVRFVQYSEKYAVKEKIYSGRLSKTQNGDYVRYIYIIS